MQQEKNKINTVIETALKNMNSLIDVNTVIGKPITGENGEYIIPVSKVTFGVLAGGGEYGKVNIFKKGSDLPYSAGNGAIVSINPCAFLIKGNNNDYKILSISKNAIEGVIDKTNDIVNEILSSGKKNEN